MRSTSSSLRILDRRHYDPCSTTQSCIAQRATIVGTVTDNPADPTKHAMHKINAYIAVIDTRISQSLPDDHATAVDSEVQLLPAANTIATVLDGRPPTFACRWRDRCCR